MDAPPLRLTAHAAEMIEVEPGVMMDFYAAGRLIGMQVLDVRRRQAEGMVPSAA